MTRPAGDVLFGALAHGDSSRVEQFFGAITGAVQVGDWMSAGNIRAIVGLRGLLKVIGSRVRAGRR